MIWHVVLNNKWNQIDKELAHINHGDIELIDFNGSNIDSYQANLIEQRKGYKRSLAAIDWFWVHMAYFNLCVGLYYLYINYSALVDKWRRVRGIEPKVLRRKDGSIGNFPRK